MTRPADKVEIHLLIMVVCHSSSSSKVDSKGSRGRSEGAFPVGYVVIDYLDVCCLERMAVI